MSCNNENLFHRFYSYEYFETEKSHSLEVSFDERDFQETYKEFMADNETETNQQNDAPSNYCHDNSEQNNLYDQKPEVDNEATTNSEDTKYLYEPVFVLEGYNGPIKEQEPTKNDDIDKDGNKENE